MSESLAWINGQFIPRSEISLPLNDVGFLLGVTVTDRCRTFRHQLFRLEDHVNRFVQNCELVRIPLQVPKEELIEIAERVAEDHAQRLSEEQEVSLVFFATPGATPVYARMRNEPTGDHPTLCVHASTLDFTRYVSFFQKGAKLEIPSVRQISSASVNPQIKHRSRLHWWLAEQEVFDKSPGSIALLLNENDHLTETAIANFLLVRDGKVLSPSREDVLPGISLQMVEDLCVELDIDFVEMNLTLADCDTADEAMICGTSFCLASVCQIGTKSLTPSGPVFERLSFAWNEKVQLDVREQVLRSQSRY